VGRTWWAGQPGGLLGDHFLSGPAGGGTFRSRLAALQRKAVLSRHPNKVQASLYPHRLRRKVEPTNLHVHDGGSPSSSDMSKQSRRQDCRKRWAARASRPDLGIAPDAEPAKRLACRGRPLVFRGIGGTSRANNPSAKTFISAVYAAGTFKGAPGHPARDFDAGGGSSPTLAHVGHGRGGTSTGANGGGKFEEE